MTIHRDDHMLRNDSERERGPKHRHGSFIIGGMRAARGGAAFAWAPLVIECRGRRYIVRELPEQSSSELIGGEAISDDEWRGVLASGEALELAKPREVAAHAALWLFRRNFFFRDEAVGTLHSRGAVLYEELQAGTRIVLVNESLTGGVTARWAERARKRAWQLARAAWTSTGAERPAEAIEAAELAIDLAGGFVVDDVAQVGLLYELDGDKERAEAYLEMARNSCGDAFYERVCEKKERFAGELLSLSKLCRRPRFGPKVAPRRGEALGRSFGRFHEKDAA